MSNASQDTGETAVAFVSGVLIGFAATLLFIRIKNQCQASSNVNDDDYYFDGGDLFI